MKGIPRSRLTTSPVMGALLLLVFGIAAPVIAQPPSPFQVRVTGTCPAGSSIRQINADGSVVCQVDTNSGGTVTSVGTGSGLTGGPITTSGTISIPVGGVTSAHILDGMVGAVDVSPAQVQLRITGSCPAGAAIQAVDQSGTVTCQSAGSGTVTAVTASAPLLSSGGTTPNISLPDVIIDALANNTAIGSSALSSNTTGVHNTASGAFALGGNISGYSNTASGASALLGNTTGFQNTASGAEALAGNTTGHGNTASGYFALRNNGAGVLNTASGLEALQSNNAGFTNTATGAFALSSNTTGFGNSASGAGALTNNTTGESNTASGTNALVSNTTGTFNTAIGQAANVSAGNLTNATAVGAAAVVNASNKIRLGNALVTVVEGAPYSTVSDKAQKENFQPVDGAEVLRKLRSLTLTTWNYIGQDPNQFRHYGPVSQEFFAAFGHDGIGTIGTPKTITSTDIAGVLMSAVQTLEKRTAALQLETELLRETVEALKAQNAELRARFEAIEKLAAVKEALAEK